MNMVVMKSLADHLSRHINRGSIWTNVSDFVNPEYLMKIGFRAKDPDSKDNEIGEFSVEKSQFRSCS